MRLRARKRKTHLRGQGDLFLRRSDSELSREAINYLPMHLFDFFVAQGAIVSAIFESQGY